MRPDLALISDCALNRKSKCCNESISVIRLFIRETGGSERLQGSRSSRGFLSSEILHQSLKCLLVRKHKVVVTYGSSYTRDEVPKTRITGLFKAEDLFVLGLQVGSSHHTSEFRQEPFIFHGAHRRLIQGS